MTEEFKQNLRQNRKKNLWKSFLQNNPSVPYLKIPCIVQNIDNKKNPFIPCVNLSCVGPHCFYSEKELLDKYEKLGGIETNFECDSCHKQINLKSFFIDDSLVAIIDYVWSNYIKKGDQCGYIALKLESNKPKWKPVIPSNMPKRAIPKQAQTYTRVDSAIRPLPDLSKFDVKESATLLTNFTKSKTTEIPIYGTGLKIASTEFENLTKKNQISFSMVDALISLASNFLKYTKIQGKKAAVFKCQIENFVAGKYDQTNFKFSEKDTHMLETIKQELDFYSRLFFIVIFQNQAFLLEYQAPSNTIQSNDFNGSNPNLIKEISSSLIKATINKSEETNYVVNKEIPKKTINGDNYCYQSMTLLFSYLQNLGIPNDKSMLEWKSKLQWLILKSQVECAGTLALPEVQMDPIKNQNVPSHPSIEDFPDPFSKKKAPQQNNLNQSLTSLEQNLINKSQGKKLNNNAGNEPDLGLMGEDDKNGQEEVENFTESNEDLNQEDNEDEEVLSKGMVSNKQKAKKTKKIKIDELKNEIRAMLRKYVVRESKPDFQDKISAIRHFLENKQNSNFTKEDLEDILLDYEDEVQREKWKKDPLGHQNNANNLFELKEEFKLQDFQNFNNLYSLMWYYYYYDIEKYKILMTTYQDKFTDLYLKAAGLDIRYFFIQNNNFHPKTPG